MELEDEDLQLFELAEHLRLPLYKLLDEMPQQELQGWLAYLKQRPIGWREDLRASHLMKAFGAKFKVEETFPSLKAVFAESRKKDPLGLVGSQMFAMMARAKGGADLFGKAPDAL